MNKLKKFIKDMFNKNKHNSEYRQYLWSEYKIQPMQKYSNFEIYHPFIIENNDLIR